MFSMILQLTACRVSRGIFDTEFKGAAKTTLVCRLRWPPLGFEPNLILQQEGSYEC